MKSTRTWILVADGARARIFLFEGRGSGLKPLDEFNFETQQARDGDIMADRPGRSFDSMGPGRHAIEPQTRAAQHNKSEFARNLARVLGEQFHKKEFDQLVIVAPPATLGDLRASISDQVRGSVSAELGKDLTHLPEDQLAGHLEKVLPALTKQG